MIAIFDCDGVLSTGQFLYDEHGKKYKTYGPDDNLALKKLREHMPVCLVSGDKRTWAITERRALDMGVPLFHMPSEDRWSAILDKFNDLDPKEIIYMGDSFTDIEACSKAAFSLCPADAFFHLRSICDYVCKHNAGHRAVAEAVFAIYDWMNLPIAGDLT